MAFIIYSLRKSVPFRYIFQYFWFSDLVSVTITINFCFWRQYCILVFLENTTGYTLLSQWGSPKRKWTSFIRTFLFIIKGLKGLETLVVKNKTSHLRSLNFAFKAVKWKVIKIKWRIKFKNGKKTLTDPSSTKMYWWQVGMWKYVLYSYITRKICCC